MRSGLLGAKQVRGPARDLGAELTEVGITLAVERVHAELAHCVRGDVAEDALVRALTDGGNAGIEISKFGSSSRPSSARHS